MRTIGGVVLCILIALLAVSPGAANDGRATTAYSIQVQAVPFADLEQGMATHRRLQAAGYLVYSYLAQVNGAPWLRVAVGAFDSRGAAVEFGDAFAVAEAMDYFVAEAPVLVFPAADQRDFVLTPSALWLRGSEGARELYGFPSEAPNRSDLPTAMLPALSPDGKTLALVYDSFLVVAMTSGDAWGQAMDTGYPFVMAESDYPWRPSWSDSSDNVAFLGRPYLANPIGLWVTRGDLSDPVCLACDPDGDGTVRWFVWHPSDERLLFVEVATNDAAAIGGRLLSVDMTGSVSEVAAVQPGPNEEIAGPLRIADGRLHYRRLRWSDRQRQDKTISEESIPLDSL